MTERVYPGDLRLARQHWAAGNFERACYFDPSLRREARPMALDAATEQTIIDRALRTVRASIPRPTSSRTPFMFDSNKLFQRAPGDAGYRERRPARAHALDSDPGSAREHIERARNHVGAVMSGSSELDAERLRGYLDRALEALDAAEAEGEDGAEHEEVMWRPGSTAEERHRAATGEDGEEAMGVVPPHSAVTTGSARRIDHRRDFNDRAQGGADGAHGYDRSGYNADALFQRSGTR